MPTGAFFRNEFGTMQIDESNPSLALKQKISFGVSGLSPYQFDVANAEFPCFAFSAGTACWVRTNTWSGSTRRFEVLGVVTAGGANIPVVGYAFDRPVDSGLNYGFKLWDNSNRLTFDANQKYGRVVHAFSNNGTFNGQSGRLYAISILTSTRRDQLTRVNPTTVRIDSYRTGGRVVGAQVFLSEILVSTITFPDSTASEYNRVTGQVPSGLVMDVTGY